MKHERQNNFLLQPIVLNHFESARYFNLRFLWIANWNRSGSVLFELRRSSLNLFIFYQSDSFSAICIINSENVENYLNNGVAAEMTSAFC